MKVHRKNFASSTKLKPVTKGSFWLSDLRLACQASKKSVFQKLVNKFNPLNFRQKIHLRRW